MLDCTKRSTSMPTMPKGVEFLHKTGSNNNLDIVQLSLQQEIVDKIKTTNRMWKSGVDHLHQHRRLKRSFPAHKYFSNLTILLLKLSSTSNRLTNQSNQKTLNWPLPCEINIDNSIAEVETRYCPAQKYFNTSYRSLPKYIRLIESLNVTNETIKDSNSKKL